ncbi:MAG: SBBP repeat-containing protein [Bryobacteraceae bacterium]
MRYSGVYQGTDLVFRGSERTFEYDFLIAPNADPSRIRMRFDGARKLSVNAAGDLLVDGWFTGRRPRIYQESAQGVREVGGRFRIHRDRTVSFETGPYDRSRALVIDPVIEYTSYLGGYGANYGETITTDTAGNIYVGGFTAAANFPGTVSFGQAPNIRQTGFVTKFAPIAGGKTQLLFTIFLGDNVSLGLTIVNGLAIDSSGNIVVVGETSGTYFPLRNPVQSQLAGGLDCIETGGGAVYCPDGFVTKFEPNGSTLIFSTYYGGKLGNEFNDVAVDSASDIYVVGHAVGPTDLVGTPTAIQPAESSANDIQVVRFDPTGKLLYATYLGGSVSQAGYTIAVEKPGVVWIGAATASPDMPTTSNTFQTTYTGISKSAYLARIDTTQSGKAGLTYATFFNGTGGGNSTVNKLFLDPFGQVVFCGAAFSNLPTTPTAMQAAEPGVLQSEASSSLIDADGFIARINPAIAGASALTYSSFIGGSDEDWAQSCALDPQGNFVVAGNTFSEAPFLTPGSPIPYKTTGSASNVFVIRIDPNTAGGRLESLWFGGELTDNVQAMATDSKGFAYLTGLTFSNYFQVSGGAFQKTYGGNDTAYGGGACCGDAWFSQLNLNVNQVGVSELALDGGDFQSGAAGSALPLALDVHLADANGNRLALAGYEVVFTAVGGVTLPSASAGLTDGTGATGVLAQLGSTNGTVTATIAGTSVSYTFHVYVNSGPVPHSVSIASGNNQSGHANALLSQPLVVQLVDANNAALALSGVNVLFSPTNASVAAAIVATDSNGRASTTVTLGSQSGSASVQVAVGALTPVTANFTVAGGPPTIAGVITAGSFGAFSSVAPGTWVEIYGSNLAPTTRTWALTDFSGNTAPDSLGGVQVSIGGQAAFIDYIPPGQVNAQLPSNIGPGSLQLTVSSGNVTSAPVSVTVAATEPGLLAPPSFKVAGYQFVVAQFGDGTYVLPTGAIAGVTSRPAKPGEEIVIYGIGFGPVVPNTPAGQIAAGSTQLSASLQILYSQTAAQVKYFGLTSGSVGLYQFNFIVPEVPDNDLVPITFHLAGSAGTQTLYTAVQQ